MWKSQVRLDDETIARVREISGKRRWSLNQTIGELLRDQLSFLERCSSGQYQRREASSYVVDDGYSLDTSDSQE